LACPRMRQGRRCDDIRKGRLAARCAVLQQGHFPTDKAARRASLLTNPIVLVSTVDATDEPNIAALPGVRHWACDHDELSGL
jgi:hypothetical protein